MPELRVFLVEDNAADIVLVKKALASEGMKCEVLVAEDGSVALSLLEKMGRQLPCPDIAIIDLNLPKIDGAELLGFMRANSDFANVPVVMMTSSRSHKDLETIQKFGATYFHKPLELSEYLKMGSVVKSLLSKAVAANKARTVEA